MPLTTVTITGADEDTDIDDLLKLSEEFSFVEWGILVGTSTSEDEQRSRFPRGDWLEDFSVAVGESSLSVNSSVHWCGAPLREIMKRDDLPEKLDRPSPFRRTQFNWTGYDNTQTELNRLLKCSREFLCADEVIFQMNGSNDHLIPFIRQNAGCSVLFDCSGGRGAFPKSWPRHLSGIKCGWAGGLSLDNLKESLGHIDYQCAGINKPWWTPSPAYVPTASWTWTKSGSFSQSPRNS